MRSFDAREALTPPKDDIIVFTLSSQRKANQSDDRLLPQGSWDIFNDLRLRSILVQPLLDLLWQVRTGPAAPLAATCCEAMCFHISLTRSLIASEPEPRA